MSQREGGNQSCVPTVISFFIYLGLLNSALTLIEVILILLSFNVLEETLLNIMFHAPMGKFQLELIYCFTFIFHRRPIQHLYVSFL